MKARSKTIKFLKRYIFLILASILEAFFLFVVISKFVVNGYVSPLSLAASIIGIICIAIEITLEVLMAKRKKITTERETKDE
jgi:membrane-bound acyltransferase YfiQ involved in biofilm formation